MAAHFLVPLQHIALNAENVAEDLSKYKGRVPDGKLEIMAAVAGLYSLCTTFYQFESALKNNPNLDGDVKAKLTSVVKGSSRTIKDLERIVKKMELASSLANSTHANAWKEITRDLRNPDSTVEMDLEAYKEEMSMLIDTLNSSPRQISRQSRRTRRESHDRHHYHHREDFESAMSPNDFAMTLSPVTASDKSSNFLATPLFGTGRRGSYSAQYHMPYDLPANPHFQPVPHRRKSSVMRYVGDEFVQYIDPIDGSDGSNSSQGSHDIQHSYYHPTLQNRSRSAAPRRKSLSNMAKLTINTHQPDMPVARRPSLNGVEHWSSRVFNAPPSESSFPSDSIKLASQCFGKNMVVKQDACEEELLKLKFARDFTARIWRQEGSQRARIVCQVGERKSKARFQSTIDLSYLSICRTGAALELRFKETLWAVLSFGNMEDLVIFYMTFIVLRQQGQDPQSLSPSEIFLDDEDLLYSG